MTKEEFTKNMAYLGIAYGKGYTPEELEVFYEFLGNYKSEALKKAIKSLIRKTKFLPKIQELIEECKKAEEHIKYEVIEYMKKKGYFHETGQTLSEYDKTIFFIQHNLIPDWLLADMRKYYSMMLTEQKQIENNDYQLIGVANEV